MSDKDKSVLAQLIIKELGLSKQDIVEAINTSILPEVTRKLNSQYLDDRIKQSLKSLVKETVREGHYTIHQLVRDAVYTEIKEVVRDKINVTLEVRQHD